MIGFLYPGQGSQHAGMLASLPTHPGVTETIAAVEGAIERRVLDLDTPEALHDTVATQIGLFTVGVALTRVLVDVGVSADLVLGHSIGGFAAAVAAGVIGVEDAATAVLNRATEMRDLFPAGYGMLATIGAPRADVNSLVNAVVNQSGEGDLFLAMENSEEQLVLAGSDRAFIIAERLAPMFGIRETIRLNMAVPSHCLLLEPVAKRVSEVLRTAHVEPPKIGYISAMTARSARTAEAVVSDLADGVSHMVRWRDANDLVAELGVSLVVQLSPGHASADLFAAAHPDIPTVAMDRADLPSSILRIKRIAGLG